MERIKAIITDDEEAARNVLSQLLEMECPAVEVLALCSDVPQTVEAIKKFQPDVVFLDVQMPHYAGYEIVDFFDEIHFEIIFTTAFDQYAIKAFELSAVDYLVKPINRKRLAQSVEKLSEKLHQKKTIAQFHILKQSLTEKTLDHIVIPELGKQTILQLADIIAIEAGGAYSYIHLLKNKQLTVTKNIKQFESLLPENGTFFRSHKSWIVNLNHLKYYAKPKLEITLAGDITAKLSKYRKEEFEAVLKR
jgi:two-component system, LytTR family, response regulator